MDDLDRAFERLSERLDDIREAQSDYIGPCTTCRYAENTCGYEVRLKCFHPLVSPPIFDIEKGLLRNSGKCASSARCGLCGERGSLHEFSIFAFFKTASEGWQIIMGILFGVICIMSILFVVIGVAS